MAEKCEAIKTKKGDPHNKASKWETRWIQDPINLVLNAKRITIHSTP